MDSLDFVGTFFKIEYRKMYKTGCIVLKGDCVESPLDSK